MKQFNERIHQTKEVLEKIHVREFTWEEATKVASFLRFLAELEYNNYKNKELGKLE